ncbi:MAG: transcription-repair coupling factor [Lentimicrobiaceae bacterium]|jgi:transcription-repair coupling factor (superfamily II helicase)|nr:transcription-repair coupling factor [Lentimicrobiaceae bacterium]
MANTQVETKAVFLPKFYFLKTHPKAFYDENVQCNKTFSSLKNHEHLLLSGLSGSSKAFVLASIEAKIGGQHLIVCADSERAAYFYNDLEQLFDEQNSDYSKKQVLFYPTSYKRPYEPEKPDNTHILSRTEVLSRLSTSERKTIIVSYPEALIERVFTRRLLAKNTFKLKVGERVSLDFLTDLLFEYDFERVDFVVEPGEFSIRGGIVDVFSFSNENPYRIEFFGEEVESIRIFDPVSQLSLQQLKQIALLPNMQQRTMLEERESILQYLPKQTCVWIENMDVFFERIDAAYKKAVQSFEKLETLDSNLRPDKLFTKGTELAEHLMLMPTVEFGSRSYLNATETILFHTQPQPDFNKKFELLLENLTALKLEDYAVYFFSESSKQLDRIEAILNDLQHEKDENQRVGFIPVTHAIHEGFIDKDQKIACYTDHQIFGRYHRYRLRENNTNKQALTIKELYDLKPGDFVTHIDHGIGRFDSLETIDNNGKQQEAIRLIYQNSDILYVSIHSLHRIAKYSGKDGAEPTLNKLGSNVWNRLKNSTKSKVKDIARELIRLYAERKKSTGFQFMTDTYLQHELEASFIYEDTPDQLKATLDVKKDLESEAPMDRLICGDVGFGKTEIAIRAAFKAATDSKQVAVLVPTTILAFQHYKTFTERLDGFPVNIDYLNRFKSTKEQNETLKKLKEGRVDILIGTHRLISKDVEFKDLGLLIIDEEQKFGVSAKEKLKQIKANVDTLTLTATPIPRTLQFSMMGARDLSIINTPPANRYPVQTEIRSFQEDIIRDAIQYEIARNGQVFFVHNRIQNIMEVCDAILRFVPGIKIGVAHGQMDGKQLENVMLDFVNGAYDVLLATTIIESGLDIPNANTIIINDAHHYGLSDLHQLRGRVGRSNKKAFCYLLTPPMATLTSEAQKRLRAIEEYSDLGSGFNIALRDLDIRGAGNILGAEQSGFINDIGFETFHKILDEAILELKESEFRDIFPEQEKKIFVSDCVIESDMEILLPNDYVQSTSERISLYSELDRIQKEDDLQQFTEKLIDRFGAIPPQTNALLNTVRLRWLARELGFEKLLLRNKMLTAYFVSNQGSPYFQTKTFAQILQYAQANPKITKLKEINNKLLLYLNDVNDVNKALELMRELQNNTD